MVWYVFEDGLPAGSAHLSLSGALGVFTARVRDESCRVEVEPVRFEVRSVSSAGVVTVERSVEVRGDRAPLVEVEAGSIERRAHVWVEWVEDREGRVVGLLDVDTSQRLGGVEVGGGESISGPTAFEWVRS